MKRLLHVFFALALVALGAQATYAAAAPIAVGKPAPEFSYRLLSGKSLTPAQLHGHKYILWSWALGARLAKRVPK